MRRLFGATLCALISGASIAHAATINPSFHSAMCLDVTGASSVNGTTVQIAHCYDNDAAQNWTLSGNTLRALGKCLDVKDGNTANGARLQIWDCGNGDNVNQQWTLSHGTLVWNGHNKCLDLNHGAATDGQPMQIWDCLSNDTAQQWQTKLTPSNTSASSTGSTTTTGSTTGSTGSTGQAPISTPGGRLMKFVNQCPQTVWVALQNNGDKPVASTSGFAVAHGDTQSTELPYQWGGRMWGRTGCTGSGNTATCETGDCGSQLACNGIGGQPASLVEFLFDGWNGPTATQDYYDISLVDAFNLPLSITPVGGSGFCHAPKCATKILAICPSDLQVKDAAGTVVNCLSSCTKYQTDATCCRNANNTSATCPAPEGAKVFKEACPDAYSYAYDDGTSTWNCTGPSGYTVTFCP